MSIRSLLIAALGTLTLALIMTLGIITTKSTDLPFAQGNRVDTLSYRHDTLSMGNTNDTTPQFSVLIQQLDMVDTSMVAVKMGRTLEELAYNQLFGDTLTKGITFKIAFEQEYAILTTDRPEEQDWEMNQSALAVRNSPTLFTISLSSFMYTGGAHGNSNQLYLNFSKESGELLTMRELIKIEHVIDLAQKAEEIFRENCEISQETSLQEAGYWFPNDQFSLPNNMGVTNEGIVFYYNPYEIAPYAMGPTEILVPMSVCKDWLTLQ